MWKLTKKTVENDYKGTDRFAMENAIDFIYEDPIPSLVAMHRAMYDFIISNPCLDDDIARVIRQLQMQYILLEEMAFHKHPELFKHYNKKS